MNRALVATAVLTLAVAVAACSGSSSKTKSASLPSGAYTYTASTAAPDECWAALSVFPPVGIGLPFTVGASNSSGEATLTLSPHGSTTNFLPVSFLGARTGNLVVTSGMSVVDAGSDCRLALRASASGTVTADGHVDLDFSASISSMTIASNGAPSHCSPYQDGTYHGIPFPTLIPATNGTCSFGYSGILER